MLEKQKRMNPNKGWQGEFITFIVKGLESVG